MFSKNDGLVPAGGIKKSLNIVGRPHSSLHNQTQTTATSSSGHGSSSSHVRSEQAYRSDDDVNEYDEGGGPISGISAAGRRPRHRPPHYLLRRPMALLRPRQAPLLLPVPRHDHPRLPRHPPPRLPPLPLPHPPLVLLPRREPPNARPDHCLRRRRLGPAPRRRVGGRICPPHVRRPEGRRARESARAAALAADNSRAPLLAVQFTVFPGAGFSLGVTIHHAAADGRSSTRFLKSWAAIHRSNGGPSAAEELPIYHRGELLRLDEDKKGLLEEMKEFAHKLEGQAKVTPVRTNLGQSVLTTFVLTGAEIDKLRHRIVSITNARPSTFVAAVSHVWMCLTKARGDDDRIVLASPAHCRTRSTRPFRVPILGIASALSTAKPAGLTSLDRTASLSRLRRSKRVFGPWRAKWWGD